MVGTLAPISAAVTTACTPGHDRAAETSIERMPVRHRAAQDHRVQRIVAREVVDELAAAAQEAHVLDAFDRAPDEGVTRGAVPPIRRHACGAALISRWSPVG